MASAYKVQVPVPGGWATTLLTSRYDIAENKSNRLYRQHKPHRVVHIDSYGRECLVGRAHVNS